MPEAIHNSRKAANGGALETLPQAAPGNLWADALPLAKRYIWWESPEKTLQNFPRFLAHFMNLATWEDQRWLEAHVPPDHLLLTLHTAPAGIFTAQSWNYWHVRLGQPTPPLPQKQIPS